MKLQQNQTNQRELSMEELEDLFAAQLAEIFVEQILDEEKNKDENYQWTSTNLSQS